MHEEKISRFDHLYCTMGKKSVNQLGLLLGTATTGAGCIKTNEFQETSVHNVFAIGDVVKGLDQIIVAEAEGAIASSHLNLRFEKEPEF